MFCQSRAVFRALWLCKKKIRCENLEKPGWDYRKDNIRSHCRDFINSAALPPMHSRCFHRKLSQAWKVSENFWRLQFWRLQTPAIATHRIQFAFIYDDFRWHANARWKYAFDGNSLKSKCRDKMCRWDLSKVNIFLQHFCDTCVTSLHIT